MADVRGIGAGTAGSTLAARMARIEHQVHLMERHGAPS
jgi:choline dehydrogenase-like flavoprotein